MGSPDLLPHVGAARLVRSVEACDSETITCTALVPADSPYATDGRYPAFVALEMGAQAAALLEAQSTSGDAERTPPRSGYLARARRVRLLQDELPVDRPLTVHVRRDGAAPPLFIYDVRAVCENEPVLHGTIAIYVEGGQSSLKQNH